MGGTVVHVAQVEIRKDSGMGRVAWHWRRAFEDRGWKFHHWGPDVLGANSHPALFPRAAWWAHRRSAIKPDIFLVHEPAASPFVKNETPCIVFSHGLERRCWEVLLGSTPHVGPVGWRTRLLFPLWRLRGCDRGMREAEGALLINTQDAAFAETRYARATGSYLLFRNGVDALPPPQVVERTTPRILFSGSWIPRKGILALAQAAARLDEHGIDVNWLLAGTGADAEVVLRQWPESLHKRTKVLSHFGPDDEGVLYQDSDILVLPSLFEGQPLALLQGMAAGLCCVVSDCCGQRDLIKHGSSGLLHTPGDAEGLALLLRSAVLDPLLRKRLGQQASDSVQERAWPRVSTEVAEYVEGIAIPGRRGRVAK